MPFKEIDYDISIWYQLAEKINTIFFDGSERYSYILVNPKKTWQQWGKIPNYYYEKNPNLPPFQGGIAGFISYELANNFNPTKNKLTNKINIYYGLYDQLFAFDHMQKRAWKIWQEQEPFVPSKTKHMNWNLGQIKQEFGKEKYIENIELIQEMIRNGDVYQVNISERFSLQGKFKPNDLYYKLRQTSPAPFSCFANLENLSIISASPERFLKISDKKVTTCPIKGTIARTKNQTTDQQNKEQLANSQKDRAENIMIVDLMRNDLSKFSEADSVKVEELCGLYSFSNVHHLISRISSKIKSNKSIFDALSECIAAGSITGAPKAMAMDIIAEIEQKPRNSYCGHMFWADCHGELDSNILIRTIEAKGNELSFRVGGGITHLSDPESEYQEVLAKAKDLINLCISDCSFDER